MTLRHWLRYSIEDAADVDRDIYYWASRDSFTHAGAARRKRPSCTLLMAMSMPHKRSIIYGHFVLYKDGIRSTVCKNSLQFKPWKIRKEKHTSSRHKRCIHVLLFWARQPIFINAKRLVGPQMLTQKIEREIMIILMEWNIESRNFSAGRVMEKIFTKTTRRDAYFHYAIVLISLKASHFATARPLPSLSLNTLSRGFHALSQYHSHYRTKYQRIIARQ